MVRVFFILLSLSLSSLSRGGEFCELQPSFFENNKESIREFENNIEESLTEIYQKEYPFLSQKFKDRREQAKQVVQIENQFYTKYTKESGNQSRRRRSLSAKKIILDRLIEEGVQNEQELKEIFEETAFSLSTPFEELKEDLEKIRIARNLLARTDEQIRPLQAPYFLYPPKINYSFRRGEVSYGDLQIEAFFRPPREDLFKLPFLNIGFETNQNTVIYTCLHFDSFDSEKNKLYVYFLNTTKFYDLNILSIFTDFDLVVRSLLSSGRSPRALVSPIPFNINPIEGLSSFVSSANSVASRVNSLSGVTNVMNQLEFLDFTAQVNPVLKLVLSNVDFGIKGVLIESDRLQLSYAGSSLFGLINFNLTKYSQRADFSSFMNIFTWEKDSDESVDTDL